MTELEIQQEKAYRVIERLGIMFGTDKPTPEQLLIAKQEAAQWEEEWRRENASSE